jgi:hypothetical protein
MKKTKDKVTPTPNHQAMEAVVLYGGKATPIQHLKFIEMRNQFHASTDLSPVKKLFQLSDCGMTGP